MMIAVQGTNEFNDYQVFLRAMSVALSCMDDSDKYFYVYAAGPAKVNSFVLEFCNLSERGMKARGKKIKSYRTPPQWIEDNLEQFNYFAYLSKPNQQLSSLANKANAAGVEVGIFQY